MDETPATGAELATVVAHDDVQMLDAVVPPIVQTSLFTFSSYAEMAARFRGETARPVYSRTDNPTVRQFERKMAALEHAEDARAFASGIGAISCTLLTFLRPGDRLVSVRNIYPRAYALMRGLLDNLGITVTFVDGRDVAAVETALDGARMLYLESPTSWTFEMQDIGRLAALARVAGAITAMDNSWASPVFQRPLDHGVDLSIQSASKYISGHSDVVAGVVSASTALIKKLDERIISVVGARLSPFDAWLLLRGLRTLPLRMRRHEESALEIARRLTAHPSVTAVLHPALGSQRPDSLAGSSGLFSFEVAEGTDIAHFCDSLRYFRLGVSWGGHESLVFPAAVVMQQKIGGVNSAIDFGVSPRLIRIHVGLESVADLWPDLEAALNKARPG